MMLTHLCGSHVPAGLPNASRKKEHLFLTLCSKNGGYEFSGSLSVAGVTGFRGYPRWSSYRFYDVKQLVIGFELLVLDDEGRLDGC